jgi:hypothetical protein
MTKYGVNAPGVKGLQVGDHTTMNNIYSSGVSAEESAAHGMSALRAKEYQVAVSQLTAALQVQPADADLHYHLALALLRGRRPHQIRSGGEISAIRQHLELARSLDHARVLRVLVDEDCGRHWERGAGISVELSYLVQLTRRDDIAEILEHVKAPMNRVWELLDETLRNGGSDA